MSQDIAKFLTKEDIESVIVDEEYKFNESTTICILRLRNGAKVVGVNYGAIDLERQDFQLGRQAARSEAVNKVWELEGYLLRQRLMETESTDNQAVFSTQDPKYSIQAGRIINTVSGVPIPYDEPIMIFRAKDCYASEHAIRPYTKALMDHLELIQEQLKREPMEFATISISNESKDLFQIKAEDIQIHNYQSHPGIKYPVAV